MDEKKRFELSFGPTAIPKETFTIVDKVYGERYYVRKGEDYIEVTKPPVVPVRVHEDRSYIMNDSASFIDAVKKYGDKSAGIVFYDKSAITMFFSEDSRKESIRLPLALSLEFRSFLGGKEKTFDQKGFLKTLETFPECVENVAVLIPMIEKVQLSTSIEFESNADPNNVTFIYQEKSGGNQTGRLPKKLTLTLPYFEGSENTVEIDADLEVTMPKEEGSKPLFKLVNIKHERTEREAIKSEINSLSENLYGWLFVNGKYHT